MAAETEDARKRDPLSIAFGERITRIMEDRKLSPQELADRCDMKKAYVWRVQSGYHSVSLRNVARLAAAFDMSMSQLLEGIDAHSRIGRRPYGSTAGASAEPKTPADRT